MKDSTSGTLLIVAMVTAFVLIEYTVPHYKPYLTTAIETTQGRREFIDDDLNYNELVYSSEYVICGEIIKPKHLEGDEPIPYLVTMNKGFERTTHKFSTLSQAEWWLSLKGCRP